MLSSLIIDAIKRAAIIVERVTQNSGAEPAWELTDFLENSQVGPGAERIPLKTLFCCRVACLLHLDEVLSLCALLCSPQRLTGRRASVLLSGEFCCTSARMVGQAAL